MLIAGVERIVFEDVQFVRSQGEAQLWATLRTAIWVAIEGTAVAIFVVHVATLKKFATGNGRAKKPDMARALCQAEPQQFHLDGDGKVRATDGSLVDDNEVDAIWLPVIKRQYRAHRMEKCPASRAVRRWKFRIIWAEFPARCSTGLICISRCRR